MGSGEFYAALGIVWVFGTAAVVLVAWHLRGKRRQEKLNMIHLERMKAMEKELPMPEFPDFEEPSKIIVTSGNWNPRWPLGAGALLIMAGFGTSAAMLMGTGFEEIWSFGLIGVFLGVGFFFYYALTRQPKS